MLYRTAPWPVSTLSMLGGTVPYVANNILDHSDVGLHPDDLRVLTFCRGAPGSLGGSPCRFPARVSVHDEEIVASTNSLRMNSDSSFGVDCLCSESYRNEIVS